MEFGTSWLNEIIALLYFSYQLFFTKALLDVFLTSTK